MTSKRVRMVDVAAAAGVSQTTASFVLNGRDHSIPPETRQRVLDAARLMGYSPNTTARALATGRTHRIGVVLNVPDNFGSNDHYFVEVVSGVTRCAPRFGYNIVLHTAEHPTCKTLFSDITSGATDGVLLIGRYANDELTNDLLETGFPTVCVSYHVEHPNCRTVDCDNVQGAYLAMKHLIALGHREIAVLRPREFISWGEERHQGICKAIADTSFPEAGLFQHYWTETGVPDDAWCHNAVKLLLSRTPRPTAILCCEETRACRITELLPEYGASVPGDMAIIGFNSTIRSERSRPPMTSVQQPLCEIGATALEMLVDQIEERNLMSSEYRFPMGLDIRESCGAVQQKMQVPSEYAITHSVPYITNAK